MVQYLRLPLFMKQEKNLLPNQAFHPNLPKLSLVQVKLLLSLWKFTKINLHEQQSHPSR